MKKLLGIFLASLLIFAVIVLCSSARGYTKDNYEIKVLEIDEIEIGPHLDYYYEGCNDSVVQIFSVRDIGRSLGTGFFVSDKNIVATNYHVVRNSNKISIIFKNREKSYDAYVILCDEENDLALLYVRDVEDYKPLSLTTDVHDDEYVYTCGYSIDYEVTWGLVSNTNSIYQGNDYIDITNVVASGNSGGPAFNSEGDVIGVVTLGNSYSTSLTASSKLVELIKKVDTINIY